jgi:ATP-dependent helicase/nuclease subunit B
VGFEKERRLNHVRSWLEEKGRMEIAAPGGIFTLTGRADRIDLLAGGQGAIMDYKTGVLPSLKQVNSLLSPQLPLEGAMLAAGGFGAIGKLTAQALIYLGIWGGTEPGKQFSLPDVAELVARAQARLAAQVARYDDENCGYLAQAIPRDSEFGGDYDHLARAREWSAAALGDTAP